MTSPPRARPRLTSPLGISLLYLCLSTVWVLGSDRVLAGLITDPRQLTWVQSVKGGGFVAVSALLLYILIRAGTRALRQSEMALRAGEHRYRQMLDRTTAVALLVDPVSRRLVDANPAACRFYGWRKRELVGKPIGMLNTLPPEELAEAVRQAQSGERQTFAFQHRTASGALRDVELHSSPVTIGERELLFSIVHDVTARAAAERALERSEMRYRALLREASDAIFVIDDTRILEANDRAASMLGRDRDSLVGLSFAELFLPEELERLPFRHADVREGRTVVMQRRMFRVGGEPIDVETSSKMLEDGRIQSIARDVTERRRLEEQLRQAQKMEAVGQLTGGIAHDLNNVLTVVLANAELLARALPADRSDLAADLTELRESAARGAAMIRKLLGFSRRTPLTPAVLDLAQVLGGLQETLRRLLPAHIEIDIASDAASALVRADAGAVEQILVNLATNARDALPDGGNLAISVHHVVLDGVPIDGQPAHGTFGCLTVSDTGTGMDAATRARVFEPFFTTKPPGQGTGLGMTMIYGLVRQQDGHVEVESSPGHGTTVRVYFPSVDADSSVGVAPPSPVALSPEACPRGTETILLVEDEAPLRRAAARILQGLGYRVMTAGDGEEALAIVQRHEREIDLVLSDLVMPRMGGWQLREALALRGHPVKLLLSSGYNPEDVGRKAGADSVPILHKPWTMGELATALRVALDEES